MPRRSVSFVAIQEEKTDHPRSPTSWRISKTRLTFKMQPQSLLPTTTALTALSALASPRFPSLLIRLA